MRRKALGILLPVCVIAGAVVGGGLFMATAGAAQPTPTFHQCPSVGFDTGCQILIWIDATGTVHFLTDPAQPTFNGSEDTLIGVQNDSNSTLGAITLQGTGTDSQGNAVGDFAFDQDGVCSGDNESGNSGFVAPPADCPYDPSGYAGPNNTFTNITTVTTTADQGTVQFKVAIIPGGSTYFSLEGNINTANLHVIKASPTLTTSTPSTAAFGSTLGDTATLSGATTPTGSVVFSLYGPNDPHCTGATAYTNTVPVGNGTNLASGNTGTNLAPGLYEWVATYAGDVNNNQATSGCGNEPVTVGQATPTLSTNATVSVTAGSAISDAAVLGGGSSPTGAITFAAFGPNNNSCTGTAAYTSVSVTVTGDNTYHSSPAFVPTAPGTYQWVATYSGDVTNTMVTDPCGSANESSMVMMAALANPTVTTTAHGAGAIGGTISDTAYLAGGNNPTGSISFKVYGPGDTSCSTSLATLAATVNGNGTYQSGPYSPTAVGTYRFVATYAGDNANNPAHTGCSDRGEAVTIIKAHPSLTTTASLNGTSTTDVGHLTGGFNPTGMIHFKLYGPNPTTCTQSMGGSDNTVSGNGNYTSSPVSVTAPGTYTWTATYSGDNNNDATTVTGCGTDPNETVNLNKARVTITTQASKSVAVGDNIHDTATISGGNNPGGTLQFALYGPGDTNCSQAPYYTPQPVPVNGDGSNYSSGDYTAAVGGTYRWVVTYSGDGANLPAISPCNAPNESVVVVPTIMTGRSYALQAQVNLLGILGVDIPPVADTGHIETPDASQTAPCTVVTTGLIQASVLCGSVVTSTRPEDHSVAQAHVANVTIHLGQIVNILNLGDITADVIDTTSTTSCDGSHGEMTVANLRIGGVLHALVTVAPNTGIEIEPGIELELNEQNPVPGGLQVNGLHLSIDLLGIRADVVIASATSDIHNCP
ncbi:MAG TPA: hypothetical protein VFW71_05185 [Actinomycetota bacterium]|nr:hypothetical protein [Actinomycetota bacterium]